MPAGRRGGRAGGGGGAGGSVATHEAASNPHPAYATDTDLSTHEADTTSIHGITNTAVLATATSVATAVSNHEADTTSVHGITDTAVLLTSASAAGGDLTGTLGNLQYGAGSIANADVGAAAAIAESKVSLFHRMFFRTGAYYGAAGSNETGALTLDRLFALPFPVSRSVTFDRIGVEVTSAGSAGAVVRLGIYNDEASGGYPGTVLLDAGTIDSTGTGWKEITISQAVSPGLYWLAAVMQVATCSVRLCGGLNASFMIGSQDGANTAGANAGYQHVGASGALPTFQSSMSVIAAAPKVRVRVA